MKSLLPLLLLALGILALPDAAFSTNMLTIRASDECKRCWYYAGSGCERNCAGSFDENIPQGRIQNQLPSKEDFEKLMIEYHKRAQNCMNEMPTELGEACLRPGTIDALQRHLTLGLNKEKECKDSASDLSDYRNHTCVTTYNRCEQIVCSGNVTYSNGTTIFDVSLLDEHGSIAFQEGCGKTWRTFNLESMYEDFITQRSRHRAACNYNNGGNTDTTANTTEEEAAIPVERVQENETRDPAKPNANPVNQSMQALGGLAQMAQPFLVQNNAQGIDYMGNQMPQAIPQHYRQGAPVKMPSDMPDFFNTTPNVGDFDEPFLGESTTASTGSGNNNLSGSQNNMMNQGGGGYPMMGGGAGMMMGQNSGNQSGGAPPTGRRAARANKKDKSIFSSRHEEGDSAVFANPADTTKQVARKVGFDQNGQKIDQSFDASRYAPQINTVYNRAINSKAMNNAMRRAAGFETMSSDNSRGYTDWHKHHNIHPGQLSIFKQMRICYIMKYSSSMGSCGN